MAAVSLTYVDSLVVNHEVFFTNQGYFHIHSILIFPHLHFKLSLKKI